MKVNGKTLQVSETLGEKINNAVVASGAGLIGGMIAAGAPVTASLFTTGYLWTEAGVAAGTIGLPLIAATAGGAIIHKMMTLHEQTKARAVIEKASSLDIDLRDTKIGLRIAPNDSKLPYLSDMPKIVAATEAKYKDIPEATVGEYLKATKEGSDTYCVSSEAKRVQAAFISELRAAKSADADASVDSAKTEGLASRMLSILRDPVKSPSAAPKLN